VAPLTDGATVAVNATAEPKDAGFRLDANVTLVDTGLTVSVNAAEALEM
jgi:hypothetical protein